MINEIRQQLKDIENKFPKGKPNLDFNLFSILKVQEKELIHSRFIAQLLDPSGSHGQRKNFLELFLTVLNQDKNLEDYSLKILIEKSFNYKKDSVTRTGFIDLLIRYKDNGTKNGKNKYIIIENKIYARDQQKQLLRYYDAALDCEISGEDRKPFEIEKPENIEIFYLTLDGHEPNPNSLGNKLCTGKKYCAEKKLVKCISYQQHIIPWIEKCKESIKDNNKSNLYNALAQYSDILEHLTRDYNKKRKIAELLEKNTNYIHLLNLLKEEGRTGDLIRDKWHFIQCHIELLFWEELETQIVDKGWCISYEQDIYSWNKIINSKSASKYGITFSVSDSCKVTIQNDFDLPKYSIHDSDFNYFEKSVFFLKSYGNHKAQKTAKIRLKKKLEKLKNDNQNCQNIINNTHKLLNSTNRTKMVEEYLDQIKNNKNDIN